MSLILNVPYAEKDEVKALGARWNANLKKWYIPNQNDYSKFTKWILNISSEEEKFIACDSLYIVEGKWNCFRCDKETKVIGFGLEKYYHIISCQNDEVTYEYHQGEINIASHIESLPKQLLTFLEAEYNYKISYSKTTNERYYSCHCQYCNAKQGEFFLFDEVDSPFFVDCKEVAEKLILHKIPLEYDVILDAKIGWGSEDKLIKKYGKMKELNIDFDI